QARMALAASGSRQSTMVSAKAAALDISSAVRATSMRMALSRLDGCGRIRINRECRDCDEFQASALFRRIQRFRNLPLSPFFTRRGKAECRPPLARPAIDQAGPL